MKRVVKPVSVSLLQLSSLCPPFFALPSPATSFFVLAKGPPIISPPNYQVLETNIINRFLIKINICFQ